MNNLTRFLLLLILVLVQVTLLPLNLGFVFLFAAVLLTDNFIAVPWLLVLSLLISLFGNLNFGIVLAAFTMALLILEIFRFLVPQNSLTKALLLIAALPISNISLLLVMNFLR